MAEFRSLYSHGFVRVAACNFPIKLGQPILNGKAAADITKIVDQRGTVLVVFPELCISGYSLEDLLLQDTLLREVEEAISNLVNESLTIRSMIVVGAPLRLGYMVFNCAVVICKGRILGVVPKSHLPNYREFYEKRYFTSGLLTSSNIITIDGEEVPFGVDLLFQSKEIHDFVLGIEICEDLWGSVAPSSFLTVAGATIIANLSSSPVTIGKSEVRELLCRSQSMRSLCAYIYVSAGEGESSTDLAWDGQISIHENGDLVAQSGRFLRGENIVVADIDCVRIRQERSRISTFSSSVKKMVSLHQYRTIHVTLSPPFDLDLGLMRPLYRFPFFPINNPELANACNEAFQIQMTALRHRLEISSMDKIIIGVSGGLDSTLALLVACHVMDNLGRNRANILAFTMPGFATSTASLAQAEKLMSTTGVTANILDIRPTANLMLSTLNHPVATGKQVYDITYENIQAGLRADYLFRLANQHNGFVLGTSDLSELALGWCTYGVGDHMSHYNVNAGMPKTLIQQVLYWYQKQDFCAGDLAKVLQKVLDSNISPELIPMKGAKGKMQDTEQAIGPYELQDFNLFYTLRYGFAPSRIAFLSWHTWRDRNHHEWPQNVLSSERHEYDLLIIRKWLRVFLQRFFGQSQFKRSASPNGPKISAAGNLSPRSDWRAPSDGSAQIWLAELDANVPTDK